MSLICIPLVWGCPTKISSEPDPSGKNIPRVCPRCHNAAVISAKSRTWFEFCFVPLIPFKASHIWMCNICQWHVPHQAGWEPAAVGSQFPPQQSQQWNSNQGTPLSPLQRDAYQPTYLNQK